MKKKFVMTLVAFVIALTGFTAIDLTNNQAQAKDWVKKGGIWDTHYHSGTFKNYTYTPTFYIWTSGEGVDAGITANGSGSGKIKAVLQQKTSKGWKNVKTFYAKKKGYTDLNYKKASKSYKTKYRFKLTNTGSKKTIKYTFASVY
ncbi:hypothetical protein ACTOS9_22025 (plasmid) [Bacillus subtilis]|nr:hypothetical protein P5648_22350 [Bacillus subtilis]WGD72652.1 hypothetical protein P5645_21950 [Bacillus subtilis]WGD74670.1 hypothetical protein P5631_00120 [Bacillus subtilis]